MALTDTPDPFPRETDAVIVHFSQPVRQIFSMLVVVGLVAAGGYLIFPALKPVLLSNPFLNGLIVAVFLIGVLACFWQVLQLIGCVNWIETFASGESTGGRLPPRLLVSLAALLRGRGRSMEISATSSRSILDSVATRIEELRDITRYLVNLLIFLGLLGTFYGLATTVPAVVETIRSLAPQDGEAGGVTLGLLAREEQLQPFHHEVSLSVFTDLDYSQQSACFPVAVNIISVLLHDGDKSVQHRAVV